MDGGTIVFSHFNPEVGEDNEVTDGDKDREAADVPGRDDGLDGVAERPLCPSSASLRFMVDFTHFGLTS